LSQKGIRYTDEFKKLIDFNLYQAGSSVSYLSREYGISNVTIYKWIKELTPDKVSEKGEATFKKYETLHVYRAEWLCCRELQSDVSLYTTAGGYPPAVYR
jgi:transposase